MIFQQLTRFTETVCFPYSHLIEPKIKQNYIFSQILVFVRNFPARTCIQVAKLPLGALVEIEAIAHLNEVINNFHPIESKL